MLQSSKEQKRKRDYPRFILVRHLETNARMNENVKKEDLLHEVPNRNP